jgi:hypothetical protein
MYGALSLIVDEKLLGVAYGVLISILNLGTTLMPIFLGYVHKKSI